MRKLLVTPVFLSLLAALSSTALAVDAVSIEAGSSRQSPSTSVVRGALQWNWDSPWTNGKGWQGTGFWDLSLAQWRTREAGRRYSLTDLAFTPTIRFESTHGGSKPYAEAGLGLHYLSDTLIYPSRPFSTHLQFGTHLGLGVRFGDKGQFDLAYRFQHVSNAGIDKPNPGIDLHLIRLQIRLD
jgi:opacity protein-like surface antigen